jgi:diaminopimelate epimerase
VNIKFYKYQGTGNDFIILDNPDYDVENWSVSTIKKLCSRKYGIGADGLIWLKASRKFDFEMVYFNADGNVSSMCGNGGRCAAKHFMILNKLKETLFNAVDGSHEAELLGENVRLKMMDSSIDKRSDYYVLQTGSPHYVSWHKQIENLQNFNELASQIRFNEEYKDEGINVNFVELKGDNRIKVRTYERGVEDETDSCGTGVTACAIATAMNNDNYVSPIAVETLGGELMIEWQGVVENVAHDVYLIGPAINVFSGELKIDE